MKEKAEEKKIMAQIEKVCLVLSLYSDAPNVNRSKPHWHMEARVIMDPHQHRRRPLRQNRDLQRESRRRPTSTPTIARQPT